MAEQRCVLALDQGTTSSRAILFDRGGGVVAVAQREFAQHYPRPGWVEHDPADLWSGIAAVAAEVRARAGVGWDEVAAVGIANQRETVLVWERSSGRPIYPAVVWQDRRTAGRCEELRASGVEDEVRRRTGLRLDPYFSATKVAWILDEVAGARRAAERGELCFGTVDSWLLWNLTGGTRHLTDASNASRTLLFDIGEGGWSDWLCELFGVPMACLPEICDSSGQLAESVWGVPLCGVAGDQHAALFGQACHRRGMAKNTYGTGCFLLLHTGDELVLSENGLLGTVAWRIGGRVEYALEGSVFVGGAVVQWLRDEMGMVGSAAECDRLAGEVEDAGGLYLVPAFTGLGAPHWLARARGLAVGITRGTGKRQFCRAALESIALQSADLLDCMEADSGVLAGQLRVDGGASRSDLLMQIQADLLGREVVRPRVVETTALGAAYLAGLGAGFWGGREEIGANWEVDRAFEPTWDEGRRDELRAGWRSAVGLLGGQ